MAAFEEKIGWSDETEMLARLMSLLYKKFFDKTVSWEECLPVKYRGAALYSVVEDQTDADVQQLVGQLNSGLKEYR